MRQKLRRVSRGWLEVEKTIASHRGVSISCSSLEIEHGFPLLSFEFQRLAVPGLEVFEERPRSRGTRLERSPKELGIPSTGFSIKDTSVESKRLGDANQAMKDKGAISEYGTTSTTQLGALWHLKAREEWTS